MFSRVLDDLATAVRDRCQVFLSRSYIRMNVTRFTKLLHQVVFARAWLRRLCFSQSSRQRLVWHRLHKLYCPKQYRFLATTSRLVLWARLNCNVTRRYAATCNQSSSVARKEHHSLLQQTGFFGEPIESPARVALLVGVPYRIKVTGIPFQPEAELYPTVELVDRTYPPAEKAHRFPIQSSWKRSSSRPHFEVI